jgi:hypothetical protein
VLPALACSRLSQLLRPPSRHCGNICLLDMIPRGLRNEQQGDARKKRLALSLGHIPVTWTYTLLSNTRMILYTTKTQSPSCLKLPPLQHIQHPLQAHYQGKQLRHTCSSYCPSKQSRLRLAPHHGVHCCRIIVWCSHVTNNGLVTWMAVPDNDLHMSL